MDERFYFKTVIYNDYEKTKLKNTYHFEFIESVSRPLNIGERIAFMDIIKKELMIGKESDVMFVESLVGSDVQDFIDSEDSVSFKRNSMDFLM